MPIPATVSPMDTIKTPITPGELTPASCFVSEMVSLGEGVAEMVAGEGVAEGLAGEGVAAGEGEAIVLVTFDGAVLLVKFDVAAVPVDSPDTVVLVTFVVTVVLDDIVRSLVILVSVVALEPVSISVQPFRATSVELASELPFSHGAMYSK